MFWRSRQTPEQEKLTSNSHNCQNILSCFFLKKKNFFKKKLLKNQMCKHLENILKELLDWAHRMENSSNVGQMC